MISFKNLTKYYSMTRAVDDVSFDIDKGEILGLLGPNGAGKTTTMRILTCYLRPTSGTALVKNYDILEDPIAVKSMIGYLPESAPLYPDMLTYDYLQYVGGVRGLPATKRLERIEELVEVCGLQAVMHKPIKEISRGYKQRVGLAHAMMSDPEILVLDEPTAGLDPNQIVQIRSIIRQMGKEKTVILSTHILSEAEATCDRIVIVNRGRIVADGSPETLGASGLQSQVLKVTLSGAGQEDVTRVLSTVEGVRGVAYQGLEPGGGARGMAFRLLCDGDRRSEVYRAIRQRDWVMLEYARERQSLEATFRELTEGEPGEAHR